MLITIQNKQAASNGAKTAQQARTTEAAAAPVSAFRAAMAELVCDVKQ